MIVLAIDPGTKLGWAKSDYESGVLDLSISKGESDGRRFVRLRRGLIELLGITTIHKPTSITVDLVVYEDVKAHKGTQAAHIYGGIKAILLEICDRYKIQYEGVPVSHIKKTATGKGNANKAMMIEAAARLFPNARIIDDNHADALCLLHWAQINYGN